MPEGVGYGPQSTASAGLTLRIIGDRAYAYSGEIATITGGYTDLLEFTTGSYLVVCDLTICALTYNNDPAAGNRTLMRMEINDEVVMNVQQVTGQAGASGDGVAVIPLVIPPYSNVTISNRAAASSAQVYAIIAGIVYK